jgi:YgiT-type zinc finger domain-containing protein
MTGALAGSDGRCPRCGGYLARDERATIPFVVGDTVVVVRDVPAEVCRSCREPYLTGHVVDRVTGHLARLSALGAELSVVTYSALPEAA